MPYGYRVFSDVKRPSKDLIDAFAQFGSADICDAMNKSSTMSTHIRPAYPVEKPVVGPAITVSVPTGSQQIRAIGMDHAQEGDVVVFNSLGNTEYAVIGGNFAQSLKSRGVNGVIVDGSYRDFNELKEMDMPVFSRGIATMGGPSSGPGEVNVPIACGSIVVNPGDIIVADNDGIVVIPPAFAEEILERVRAIAAKNEADQEKLLRGEVLNVDKAREDAAKAGCEFV